MVEHEKMLECKILFEVTKIFAQECSNGDLELTLAFFMVKSNLLSVLLYRKS